MDKKQCHQNCDVDHLQNGNYCATESDDHHFYVHLDDRNDAQNDVHHRDDYRGNYPYHFYGSPYGIHHLDDFPHDYHDDYLYDNPYDRHDAQSDAHHQTSYNVDCRLLLQNAQSFVNDDHPYDRLYDYRGARNDVHSCDHHDGQNDARLRDDHHGNYPYGIRSC